MKSDFAKIRARIKSLGGVHDARLLGVTWLAADSSLTITIDDLFANFNGLPEYRGPQRAAFVFSEVTSIKLELDVCEPGLSLYDWTFPNSIDGEHGAVLSFSPAGRILIRFRKLEYSTIPRSE